MSLGRLGGFIKLEGAQAAASDPLVHAALSASAGTGKTHVLTSRILRLLLRGTPPSTILCLTFTKAGAAEMANRIGERLAHWARLDDRELDRELEALGEVRSKAMFQRARRLFAQTLEAPGGGLRIQTIHSFAQALLAAFPAEAGIPPGFRPIEGRAEQELARRTLATLLAEAEARGDRQLLEDISALSLRMGEGNAEAYLMEAARAHEAMAGLGDPATIHGQLLDRLGLPADAGPLLLDLDEAVAGRLLAANRHWATETGRKIVANLTAFLAADAAERLALLGTVGANLVTAKGEPCKAKAKQVEAEPDYELLLAQFAQWLVETRTLVAAVTLARIQAAGLRAGQAFAKAYTSAKRAAGFADFDDLIAWTRRLFGQDGMGEWVRYKLDQRTDHILVDEAQDTNADQWAIVDALAGEYFSGNPEAEQRWRTLFTVGDNKQAIFSFQGTDPREYERFRRIIADRASSFEKAREFRNLSIDASFRSAPAILEVVDALIGEVGHEAMGLEEAPNAHAAFHAKRAGTVELWPAYEPPEGVDDEAGEEGWIEEPLRLYADHVARQVRQWLADAPVMGSTGRALTPGDVLILVRSRTELASLIVARLYAQGVPVAGIDRLHLHKPLAVRDLLSAIAFAVQPLDDLNLASLLVSPLIGWSQEQLYDLAFGRKGSLWNELSRRRDEADAHAILAAWLAMADYVSPSAYLETILSGPLDGRRKLLRRLGEEARDPIEELVSSAIAFEQEEGGSLDHFLAWFGQGAVEVKRDPSAPVNAVRVMTVHNAKGQEAPLVLLADATYDPARVGGTPSIVDLPLGGVGAVPVIRPRKDERAPLFRVLIEQADALERQEHWRLAYVGLTRARDRLVVAGVKPSRSLAPDSWHQALSRAMEAMGAAADGGLLRWESGGEPIAARPRRSSASPIAVPDLLKQSAPPEARPPRPLAPSQIVEDRDRAPPPSPDMRAAARRGILLHSLFERLPAVAGPSRRDLARRWLERAGVGEADGAEIADAALRIIEDPDHALLFAPDTLAEAPIVATLADGRVVAGTVDRLRVEPDRIRLVDFKTGRAVPPGVDQVPAAHRAQMQAYREALAAIFPGRRIEAALLYTSGPTLIELGG